MQDLQIRDLQGRLHQALQDKKKAQADLEVRRVILLCILLLPITVSSLYAIQWYCELVLYYLTR